MSRKDKGDGLSIWAGHDKEDAAHPIPAAPPKDLTVNGSPVVDQSHEYVIRKPRLDAQD